MNIANVMEKLKVLPPVACCNVKGPASCYCARGTTKPIAEISKGGEVLQTYCSASAAQSLLVRVCVCVCVYFTPAYPFH
jgi:hypothetical protein